MVSKERFANGLRLCMQNLWGIFVVLLCHETSVAFEKCAVFKSTDLAQCCSEVAR